MITQNNIHHSAIMKPNLSKCKRVLDRGVHAYVKTKHGYEQCIECGNVKKEKRYGIYRQRINSSLPKARFN